jgi:hypothetical protein
MNRVTLNRKQIGQLVEIYERFTDTENFTIESESTSGIGPNISIRFDLFEKSDTKVDITDVSTW